MREGSTLFFSDMLGQHRTGQVLCLLTVTGEMAEPLRLVCDVVAVTSRGNAFMAFPFGWQKPSESEAQNPGRIVVPNIDKRIGEIVRSAKGELRALMEFVIRSEPDTVLSDFRKLRLRNARVTGVEAAFDLVARAYANAAWPNTRATPAICPGLWA